MQKLRVSTSTSSHYFHEQLKKSGLYQVHSIFNSSFNIVNQEMTFLNINQNLETLSAIGLMIEKDVFQKILKAIKVNDVVKLDNNKIIFYTSSNPLLLELVTIDLFNPYPITVNPMVFSHLLNLNNLQYDPLLNNRELTFQQRVGRGTGFTPSGDDFNWGYMMILSLFNQQLPSLVITKTTLISQSIYDRLYQEQWGWIYVQLFQSSIPQIQIDSLMTYGHTSGQDTLFGMKCALEDLKTGNRCLDSVYSEHCKQFLWEKT